MTNQNNKKDIFYQNIEGKLDTLKQPPHKEEKATKAERINTFFSISLGLVILVGLLFTLFNILR